MRAFLSSALVAAMVLGGCETKTAETTSTKNESVVIFGRGYEAGRIQAPCVIRPLAMVKVKSEISGRVDSIHAAPGDHVAAGQLLAVIDKRALRNEMERNVLAQKRLRSQISLQNIQVERARRAKLVLDEINSDFERMAGQGNSSTLPGSYSAEAMDIREKETGLRQSQLALEDLQLQEREISRNLKLAEIKSPLAGLVLSRSVEEGAIVGSGVSQFGGGDVLFEVADISRLKAECYAREEDAWQLAKGQQTQIVTDALSDRSVDSHITHVAPLVELVSGVPRLKFESEFTPPDSGWRIGVNAIANVKSGSATASRVLPKSAIQERNGKAYVRVKRGRSFEVSEVDAVPTDTGWMVEHGLNRGDMVAEKFDGGGDS